MTEPQNRVVQVRCYGDPDGLEVVDAIVPTAARGEVRVRVLASSLQYTDVLIRRHLYPQTTRCRPPFVMGYDVVGEIDQVDFDGVGEDGYRRSFAALKPGGLLLAIGYSAGVQAHQRMRTILMSIARMYLWRFLPGGRHTRFYSINAMRARHPAWFQKDLERLLGLLATHAIRPRVAERISFDEVADAHRRIEAGGLEGKLVLCPDLPSRRDRVPPRGLGAAAVQAAPAS
ncbi:MAG TPA: zinc-binding dehydrogenase [Vicinamibacterales bacterium]|nr:zinc-binding dehydrogenase [Vicinamibacterales bacterium]